jgi:hypothetical protein
LDALPYNRQLKTCLVITKHTNFHYFFFKRFIYKYSNLFKSNNNMVLWTRAKNLEKAFTNLEPDAALEKAEDRTAFTPRSRLQFLSKGGKAYEAWRDKCDQVKPRAYWLLAK